MKVAITGAAGYVGGLLVRAHADRGDSVHALARDAARLPALEGVTRYGVDITRTDAIPVSFFDDADVFYHCAAELRRNPLMRTVNVDVTSALIARARGRIGHWVQVSSVAVYGGQSSGVITEESPLRAADAYGRTKAEADALLHEQAGRAFSYTILRPSTVIGPAMRSRALYSIIDAIDRGMFFFVGAPGANVNYVAEKDLVKALVLCGTRPEANRRTYNLSQHCTLEHAIAVLATAVGRTPPRLRVPKALARLAAEVGRIVPRFPLSVDRIDVLTNRVEYSAARIERELGYRHRTSLDSALQELAALWTHR